MTENNGGYIYRSLVWQAIQAVEASCSGNDWPEPKLIVVPSMHISLIHIHGEVCFIALSVFFLRPWIFWVFLSSFSPYSVYIFISVDFVLLIWVDSALIMAALTPMFVGLVSSMGPSIKPYDSHIWKGWWTSRTAICWLLLFDDTVWLSITVIALNSY